MVRDHSTGTEATTRSPHTRGDGPQYSADRALPLLFSPHAWGWSAEQNSSHQGRRVLPTRVGMVRSCGCHRGSWRRSPHTRGDGPRHAWRLMPPMSFSPHAWGWSVNMPVDVGRISVLPTRVGMVRTCGGLSAATLSSPHTRGDGPITASTDGGPATFSPHAWGWSVLTVVASVPSVVLPTRVGMVR